MYVNLAYCQVVSSGIFADGHACNRMSALGLWGFDACTCTQTHNSKTGEEQLAPLALTGHLSPITGYRRLPHRVQRIRVL